MKTFLAYTRVSTVKQGERSSSLQEQRSAIEAYAAKHGLVIGSWHEEMETAAKRGRRVFNQVVTLLRKQRAAGLIVHKIDRSARNLKDWADLQELLDRGIEVHFAHETLDMLTRGGRLAADIQAVVAADYIRNLRDEAKKGLYGRLKQGIYPFAAPRGYLDRGGGKAKEIDPDIAPLVRKCFELYASGRYNLEMLRDVMFRLGLKSKAGTRLSLASLATLLHNPFYIGIIRISRTGETFEGIHEPLISKKLYDQVQVVAGGRVFARPQKHMFTYRRMIRCATCNYALIGERQKGHVYYRCHTRTCHGVTLRESAIDTVFDHFLALLTYDDRELRDLRDLVAAGRAEAAQADDARKLVVKKSLAALDDRLTRLTDAFLDGDLDRDTFQSRKTTLQHERRAALDQLEEPQTETRAETILKKLELGNTAQQQFQIGNGDQKRETVKSLTSNLWAEGKELAFAPLFPFDEVAIERNDAMGAPFRVVPRRYVAVFSWVKSPTARRKTKNGTLSDIWRALLEKV